LTQKKPTVETVSLNTIDNISLQDIASSSVPPG